MFEPTRAAALAALAWVQPHDYARTRNALDGSVTRLSPYLTHGFLTLAEVADSVLARHELEVKHQFIFELGWRAYYRHVWAHRADGILSSLHPGVLEDEAYARELPADLAQGCTGVPVIDCAVRELHATGYLHNHARMWLASYVVHLRKVHWRIGADWMFGLLLDGDLASNHLSWQWVAATGSHKPYLFNAENVARYAPPEWHSSHTVVDTTYEQLARLARDATFIAPAGIAPDDSAARLHHTPPDVVATTLPGGDLVVGRDVWLAHPWALGEPPADHVVVGWLPSAFFEKWGWSERRWAFVGERFAILGAPAWWCDREQLGAALSGARSVVTQSDPHINAHLPQQVQARHERALFPAVNSRCDSFSRWWGKVTKGCTAAQELLAPTLV